MCRVHGAEGLCWSSRSLGSEIMDHMCEACILLRKVSNKSNSSIFWKLLVIQEM